MNSYPEPVTKQSTKNILEQMDNSIYKINEKKGKFDIGILCSIKYQNKDYPILITTYNAINENSLLNKNYINLSINNENINIEFGEIKYINKDLDLSIMEIKNDKGKNLKFLDIDDCLLEKESEIFYYRQSMYIIHSNCVSYGIINDTNKSELILSCNINSDFNGSPIFNLFNNKLIGIYKYNSDYYAKGICFKYIINEFIKEIELSKKKLNFGNSYDNNFKNEINILINIEKNDINKNIYFLGDYKSGISQIDDIDFNIDGLNTKNTELYINKIKYEYKNFFIPEKEGEYNINLKFYKKLTDISFMFANCENIIQINFISFNTKYVTNMKYMFYQC